MISSIAYMLVGVMAPYEAGFYLSRGNETTCKMQGFMIQLGQSASMFYNLCLSLYFFMVIMLSWKEKFLRRILVLAHVMVIVTALGLSIGAIPYFEAQFGVCGILPPLTASQWQVSLFYTAPVCVVLVVLTTVTISICYRVYSQNARVHKWRTDKNASITRKVFWQSVWYVSAFYVTLPFVLLSFYVKFKSSRYFWIYIVTAILAPLQGMMNALIYFQRTKDFRAFWSRLCCCQRQSRKPVYSASGRFLGPGLSNHFSNSFQPGNSSHVAEAAPDTGDDVSGSFSEGDGGVQASDCGLPNVVYLKDDTSILEESNDHEKEAYDDPLEPESPAEMSYEDSRAARREAYLARLQEMTQPMSNLRVWTNECNDVAEERAQIRQETGGVLEYWELHEVDKT